MSCKWRDPDGLSEVGLPYSSKETRESGRSEGGQQAFDPGVEAESAREAVRRWNRKQRE